MYGTPDQKSLVVTGFEQGGSTPTYWVGSRDGSDWKKAGADCGMLTDVSADEKHLVGGEWRGAKMGIYSYSLEDQKCTQIEPGVSTLLVKFSPDRKWIEWVTTGSRNVTIYRRAWKDGRAVGEKQAAFKLPFAFPANDEGNGFDFTPDLSVVAYVRPGGHADLYFTPLK